MTSASKESKDITESETGIISKIEIKSEAEYFTAKELAERGFENLPDLYKNDTHLIYSSPASLGFNSPGAEGFGVKRAGLTIPGSVMLIVSPGCCGRNTSELIKIKGLSGRFFYLNMDETDLVTGRHLKKISDAVRKIVSLFGKPSVVMICITCVDALLGTDLLRVCEKASLETGVRVRPCYMYALTREGRKPPMVNIRQTIYSMLEKLPKNPASVNLLGYFAPLDIDSDLLGILKKCGIKNIRQAGSVSSFDEFLMMGEANFNLVLHPEARECAEDMRKRLGIPWIELKRFYDTDLAMRQYKAFLSAIGAEVKISGLDGWLEAKGFISKRQADHERDKVISAHPDLLFSIGECSNTDPFELALYLIKCGYEVDEIFATPGKDSFAFIKRIAKLSGDTAIYSNTDPSMRFYAGKDIKKKRVTIGRDASFYHKEAYHLPFNEDVQPFGYEAAYHLWRSVGKVIDNDSNSDRSIVKISNDADNVLTKDNSNKEVLENPFDKSKECSNRARLRGFSILTPAAPDQSGAAGVVYELGGMTVIIDAGGCTGNILGFDERRWGYEVSAVFSAGLRDMDAVMGDDRRLIDKIKKAYDPALYSFITLIGTPVPAVTGMDYDALCRMIGKRTGCPVINIPTDGMHTYERGAEEAYIRLFDAFGPDDSSETVKAYKHNISQNGLRNKAETIAGIIGCSPLEIIDEGDRNFFREYLEEKGYKDIRCYGADATAEDYRYSGCNDINIVTAASGVKAAVRLQSKYGTPFEIGYPGIFHHISHEDRQYLRTAFDHEKKILIIADFVAGSSLRTCIEKELGIPADMTDCASFQNFSKSVMNVIEKNSPGSFIQLTGEDEYTELINTDRYYAVISDRVLLTESVRNFGRWIELPWFALSGKKSAV